MAKKYTPEEIEKLRVREDSPSASPKKYTPEEIKRLRVDQPKAENFPVFDPEGFGNTAFTDDPNKAKRDVFREHVAPIVEGGVVNTARTVGTANAGPVAGFAAGTGADFMYKNTLQKWFPNWFGKSEDTTVGQLGDSVKNTAIDFTADRYLKPVASAIGKTVAYAKDGSLKSRLLNHFFPTPEDSALRARIQTSIDAGDDLTLGQITGNKNAQAIEDAVDPQRKAQRIKDTHAKVRADLENVGDSKKPGPRFSIEDPTGTRVRSEDAVNKAKANNIVDRSKVRNAYNEFAEERKNVKTTTTVLKDNPEYDPTPWVDAEGKTHVGNGEPPKIAVEIREPIIIKSANEFNKKLKTDFELSKKDPTYTPLPSDSEGLNKLEATVASLDQIPTDVIGNKVLTYKESQRIYKEIDGIYDGLSDEGKKRFKTSVETIKDLIHKDQRESIEKYWGAKPALLHEKALEEAQKIAIRYDNEVGKRLVNRFKDPDILSEELMKDALSSREKAQKYIHAVGGRQEIGPEFYQRFLNKNFDNVEGVFDGKKMLQEFMDADTQAMARTVIPSPKREQIEFALKRLSNVDPKIGSTSIFVNRMETGNALQLAGNLAEVAATGKSGGIIKSAIKTVAIPMSRGTVQKLFFDPSMARKVARLAMLPSESSEARALSKAIFGALRGEQMEIQYENGEKEEQEIK